MRQRPWPPGRGRGRPLQSRVQARGGGSFEYDFRVDYRGRGVYFTDDLTTRCEPKHLRARFRAGLRALHAKQVQFDAERRERDDVDTFCKALRAAAPGEYALSFASRDAAGNYLFRFSFLKPHAVIHGGLDLRTRGLQHAIDTVRSLLAVQ